MLSSVLPPLRLLAVDEPLGSQLAQVRAQQQASHGSEQLLRALEQALLEVLTGAPEEAESTLHLARSLALPLPGPLELMAALVHLEAGQPTRAQGALGRAGHVLGLLEGPTAGALLKALQAQALLLQVEHAAAASAAREALATLPPGEDTPELPLSTLVHVVAAECLWAAGELSEARQSLRQSSTLPGRHGLLAARAERLELRLGLVEGGGGAAALRPLLERTVARLQRLDAPRDLGLTLHAGALVAAADGREPPIRWLIQAHPHLAQAGTLEDRRLLRQAFRAFGRREMDRLADEDYVRATEALRERHQRLRDVLSAQADSWAASASPPPPPLPLAERVEAELGALGRAHEEVIGAVEHILLDREQVRRLASASQEIADMEELESLQEAVPRLARSFIFGSTVALLEVGYGGQVTCVGGEYRPASLPVPHERIQQAVVTAIREGMPQVIPDDPPLKPPRRLFARLLPGRSVVVPVRRVERPLALAVFRAGPSSMLDERDVELLSFFGSLAGTALARARSSAAVERSAARDAATLAAIRDGIVTLDERGAVSTLNRAAERLLRATQEQLLGRRLQHLAHLAHLAEALASERALAGEVVALPQGEVLVRAQPFEGGVVVTLQARGG